MAKNNKSVPPPPATALATVDPANDALAALIDEVGVTDDGLTEVGAEDIKLPTKVFNFKGVDTKGDPIPPNVFYDTVAETTARSLELMLIYLHKTNEWREYSESEGKSKVRCRSFDQVEGTMDDGTLRPCKGCPDAQWTSAQVDGKSKRAKRCGPVYNMFAADLETRQPCVVRFKRTSLTTIQTYLNKHHIGRRVVNGKRTNWPLFVFHCRASLKMSDDKKYALPMLDKVGVLSRDDIAQGAETVQYVRDVLLGELSKVIESDRSDEGGGGGGVDPDKFGGGTDQDFVE